MKNILKISMNDLKKISTNVVAIVVVMGLCILPSLYAWFNINSNWAPYDEDATSNLKIAVYSNDEGITIGSVSINMGDSVVDALKNNSTIGWQFPEDERTAINGVYDGTYYAALVIPDDFTQSIASVTDGNLQGGTIAYYENEKKNAIATKITAKAKNAVQTQVNTEVFGTITEILFGVGDTLGNVDEEYSLFKTTADILDSFSAQMQQYIDTIDTMDSAADATTATLGTMSKLTPKIAADMQSDLSFVSANPVTVADLQTVSVRIQDYIEVLKDGQANLKDTRKMLKETKKMIRQMKKELSETEDSEEFQTMISLLENQPEAVGSYLSSLVNLETVDVYETENYGSQMAPFYTVLAIWVGALILVAIIHTKVLPVQGITKMKSWQAFFGRYSIFFAIGQIQALICVLGDLFFLEIQCEHPILFWLAAAMTSFVFTIFIYALTFAFGNIGEALAVVIMVIQVAGAGGTFPMEVLPTVYQNIYKFLPFPYCMDALRECVSGFYQNDYWICMGTLLLYVLASLVIGLVLRIPFIRLNEKIEASKEETDLMV